MAKVTDPDRAAALARVDAELTKEINRAEGLGRGAQPHERKVYRSYAWAFRRALAVMHAELS